MGKQVKQPQTSNSLQQWNPNLPAMPNIKPVIDAAKALPKKPTTAREIIKNTPIVKIDKKTPSTTNSVIEEAAIFGLTGGTSLLPAVGKKVVKAAANKLGMEVVEQTAKSTAKEVAEKEVKQAGSYVFNKRTPIYNPKVTPKTVANANKIKYLNNPKYPLINKGLVVTGTGAGFNAGFDIKNKVAQHKFEKEQKQRSDSSYLYRPITE